MIDLLAHSPKIARIVIGEFQVNGFSKSDLPPSDEIGDKLGKMEGLKWSRKAEPMGELFGKCPVAMGATGDQSGDTLLGDILNKSSPILLGFLLETVEEERNPTAPINPNGLIGNPRHTEKGL